MSTMTSHPLFYAATGFGLIALVAFVSTASSNKPRSLVRNATVVQPTRIEVDNQNHQIRFVVDGKRVAVMDALSAKN